MQAEIGELISTGSIVATEIDITNSSPNLELEHVILVVSGSVKFGKGSINAGAYAFPAGEKIIIKCRKGELYAEQSAASDTFVVTI